MKLPRRCVTHCDSSSSLYPSISSKNDDWVEDRVTLLGIKPKIESVLYFPLFLSPLCSCRLFFFSSRLAERPLECSLWPSHWQMLLWNVMKFEMGAAVTIILGQGLSLAWYHYLWQLESATRERERAGGRDGAIGCQAVILQSYERVEAGKQTSGAFMER